MTKLLVWQKWYFWQLPQIIFIKYNNKNPCTLYAACELTTESLFTLVTACGCPCLCPTITDLYPRWHFVVKWNILSIYIYIPCILLQIMMCKTICSWVETVTLFFFFFGGLFSFSCIKPVLGQFDSAKMLRKSAEWAFNRVYGFVPKIERCKLWDNQFRTFFSFLFFFFFFQTGERFGQVWNDKKNNREKREMVVISPLLLCLSQCLRFPITVHSVCCIWPGTVQMWVMNWCWST